MPSRAKRKGVGVWDCKEKENNSQENENEKMFGKLMLAGPYRSNGTKRNF